MPRTRRWNTPGDVYHLISRFVDRDWFIADQFERARYLRLLGIAISESDWTCLAYAVMSNHIHLVVEAGTDRLGDWVRKVHAPFAMWMNAKRDRIGNLFCRGPKDFCIRPENIARTTAYVHNNPVRAKVVAGAKNSTWTSHRAYCGLAVPPPWLSVTRGLQLCGFNAPARFDEFVSSSLFKQRDPDLRAIRRELLPRGAIETGSPTDGDRISVPLIARPWAVIRPDPRRLLSVVADIAGIPAAQVSSRRKLPPLVEARKVTVRAGLELGLTGADIAAVVGITQQAASKLSKAALTPRGKQLLIKVLARM